MKNVVTSLAGIVCLLFALSGCTTSPCQLTRADKIQAVQDKVDSVTSRYDFLQYELTDPRFLKTIDRLGMSGNDLTSLLVLLERVDLDLQRLKEFLDVQDAVSRKKDQDASILLMRSMELPFARFDPPQTLYDGIKFLSESAKNHPEGNGQAFPILATMDCEDQLYVAPDCSEKSYSKKPIRWPILPKITAENISYYELLKLMCYAVNCELKIDSGLIRISKQDCEGYFIDRDYPVPLSNPDRDWLTWLAKRGVKFREGTEIFYEKKSRRLIAHIDVDELIEFENAFPLIYSGIEDEADDR